MFPSLDPDPPREWVSVAEHIGDDPASTTEQQDVNMLLSRGRAYLASIVEPLLDNTAHCR